MPVLLVVVFASVAAAAEFRCSDGKPRRAIDIKQLALTYSGSELISTMGALSSMSARLTIAPKTLQVAAETTQQWNEYLKGLAAGWNSCAIDSEQYSAALTHLAGLKRDAVFFKQILKEITDRRALDEKRLASRLDTYIDRFRSLATVSGQTEILERLIVLRTEVLETRKDLQSLRDEMRQGHKEIFDGLNAIKAIRNPTEVSQRLKSRMHVAADQAEMAYALGFQALHRHQAKTAVTEFARAKALVPLPEISLALGTALWLAADLLGAEQELQAAVQASDQKSLRADALGVLALVLRDKGSLALSQKYGEQALILGRGAYGDNHPAVAILLANLASIEQANGNLERAVEHAQHADRILAKPDLDVPGIVSSRIAVSTRLGSILRDKRDFAMAEHHAVRALQAADALGPNDPYVAIAANTLGTILHLKGDAEEAQRLLRRALQVSESVYTAEHPSVAWIADNLGQSLRELGDLEGALHYTQRAVSIAMAAYGPENPDVAICLGNLGQILVERGSMADLKEAQLSTEQALRTLERLYRPDHPIIGIYARTLAQILKELGSLPAAKLSAERALRIAEKEHGPAHPAVAFCLSTLGLVLLKAGEPRRAEAHILRAMQIADEFFRPDHPFIAINASHLSWILKESGDLKGARHYRERALLLTESTRTPNHRLVVMALNNLSQILQVNNFDLMTAEKHAQRSLIISEKVNGQDHRTTGTIAGNLAAILIKRGKLHQAQGHMRQALTIARKEESSQEVGQLTNNLAQIMRCLGDYAGARRNTEEALQIFTESDGPNAISTQQVRRNLESISAPCKAGH